MAEKLTVFISGTMRDLPTERERVAAVIREMGLEPIWAEERGATDRPPRDECERMARTCHVYLGLYSLSYGWKFPPDKTTSATEVEWQTAKKAGKPMLIYRQKGDPNPEQAAFLEKAGEWQKGRYWYEFETLDDLLPRLRDDLARLITESFRPERPALLADYRAHLRRLYADLPLSGIPVPLDVTLPLDQVYVKLRALPEQEEAARRKAGLSPDRDEELPRRLAERLWRQREEGEEAARRLEEAKPISPEEGIARHDHLTVLGEAGAGKSTLLRHLAWERAGDPEALLPLLVPLGRADALISQTGCSFLGAALDLLTEHKAGEERDMLKQALADAIGDKKVLFLYDGLDEAHLARQSVVAGLEKLAAEGQRLVVTSRPLGYERLAATDMAHFQMLPLLPEDAEAFSDRWFRALAQARGVPKAKREEWARERSGWLQRQLDERPGLHEVARNPLLLTFLAVLAGDEPQRDLPHRRKELYREYVERLFTEWEARRRREGELSLGRLRGEEARRVALWGLYCTAWHLHRVYYGGDEGPQAVRGEIEPLLARDLRKRWEFGALQAEAFAVEVLRFWEGAGLLDVYRLAGQEWLAFRHLTFQEYGAARALAEEYRDDPDGLWQCLSPYLLRPQWAGVIPLALAHLSGIQATSLVERLLAANEDDENWQRSLFLVAAALAEGAEVADAPHRQVVDALLNLARTQDGWWVSGDAFSALGRLVGDGYAAAGLLALARDRKTDEWVRMEAAMALEELGWADEATELLLALAQGPAVKFWVRVRAAEALEEMRLADDLLAMAQDRTADDWKRELAAEALGKLGLTGQTDEAEAWLALAKDSVVSNWVRVKAGEALERLGRADEATKTWLTLAKNSAVDDHVRVKSVEALENLERTDDVANAWLILAKDPTVEARIRKQAVEALEWLERADDLLTLARDPAPDEWVRVRATGALGCLERTDDLLALAKDWAVDVLVRVEATKALGEIECADDLLALAQDRAVGAWVRMEAAEALGKLWWATPEVLAGLRTLAEEPGTPESVRRAAREALKRLEK
jgi:hypothetical protein